MLVYFLITVVLLFYISLIIELCSYSIPSVVSTKNLLSKNKHTLQLSRFRNVLEWSKAKKICVLGLPLTFVYLLHALPLYLLYQIYTSNFEPYYSFLFYVGLMLVILGRLLSHFYLYEIRAIKSRVFKDFVAEGVFRWSRNPGLLSLYISFLGFFLIYPSILFLVSYVVYLLHMHFRVIMEEDHLSNVHGSKYLNYLKKVRRYL
jgi:protein-S-isoprenylcysteine O-methyltransferase Ste14